ncbi:MAG: PepSY-associated TM helix domain-containing protein [Reichenbachiella sp.]|uniref:PepSY-associated TM helix domain-containing protein n=2 Tax=Reichenbachiella sp. TaxID=2184521 RepID=UPI003298E24D
MSKRIYNVLFHLHTVSGIVISVILYVIFFTGSFSFFRDEIANWERNHDVEYAENISMDLDHAFDSLDQKYALHGRNISISKHYVERRIGVSLDPSQDSLADEKGKARHFFYQDTETLQTADYASSYSLGEFLYRLHFLAQIPRPYGYYLSGFTAFFFLFAIITGILVHWEKIISNFYLFRPWAKLKALWTDAHTALGTIGLPFQFVYAVTGAFFMIKALLIAPSVFALYDGDESALYNDLGYSEPEIAYAAEPLTADFSINALVSQTEADWPEFNINHLHIFNYGDVNMHVSIEGETDRKSKFTGPGKRLYKVEMGELIAEKNPFIKASYLDGVKNSLYRLHYGDYGGYALKVISFVLGIVSCFVIASGIMIWLVARRKKNIPEKRRKFNEGVARVYMAICLSMYPVTALAFIAVKTLGQGMTFLYQFYFTTWLIASVFLIWKKDIGYMNRVTLLSGIVIGFLIPIVNGLISGEWLWESLRAGHFQVLFVDVIWLGLSVTTLWVWLKMKNKPMAEEEKPTVDLLPKKSIKTKILTKKALPV